MTHPIFPNPEHPSLIFQKSRISIVVDLIANWTSTAMNPLDLIETLENDLKSICNQLKDLKFEVREYTDKLRTAQEQMWMMEQLADPDHDGRPYSDTLRP